MPERIPCRTEFEKVLETGLYDPPVPGEGARFEIDCSREFAKAYDQLRSAEDLVLDVNDSLVRERLFATLEAREPDTGKIDRLTDLRREAAELMFRYRREAKAMLVNYEPDLDRLLSPH